VGPLALRNHLVAGVAACALAVTLVNCTSSSTSATATTTTTTPASAAFPVINNTAAIAKAEAMVANMTQAEMFTLVEGASKPSTDTIVSAGYTSPISDGKVVIPSLYLGDSPNGVGNSNTGVTQFPTAQSVASSWDVSLAKAFGDAAGAEWAGKAENCALGPAMNIIRLPYGGRSAEYLSEDPYLAGQIAANESLGIQGNGVIATAKHYALNNQEDDRSGVNVIVSDRALREIYLPAFESTLKLGGAMAVMGAYNKFNGSYACENTVLMTDVLRTDWGFNGFVMSDWGACHSTVGSVNAGLDQEMPGSGMGSSYYSATLLSDAITAGTITSAQLKSMATHILTAMYQAAVPFTNGTPSTTVSTAAHRTLGVQISEDGSVLLQNTGSVLPLSKTTKVAVIGPGASAYPTNDIGGSGAVDAVATVVTPLAGIQTEVGSGLVTYALGSIGTGSYPLLSTSNATITTASGGPTAGFTGSFTDSTGASIGTITSGLTEVDYGTWPTVGSTNLSSTTGWTADFVGYLNVATAQSYDFSLTGSGVSTLKIDGTTEISVSSTSSSSSSMATVALTAGVHSVEVKCNTSTYTWPSSFGGTQAPTLELGWNPDGSYLAAAVTAATAADVAIVCVGDSESEGSDHTAYLSDDQNALVTGVAAVAKKTVVVLNAGSPLIYPWASKVNAILDNHYGGEDEGTAIAALLYGDVNPSGKLTVTHAASEGQLYGQTTETYPGVELSGDSNLTVTYTEDINVGYRWFDKYGLQPAFPFGHGLSYTSFGYSGLKVSPSSGDGSSVTVTVKLANTGSVTGKEVAQLYVGFPSTTGEPPRQLKGFQKVSLDSGGSQTVTFTLDPRSFSYWGSDGWTIDPGTYTLYVGSSSRDIRQTGTYTVTE
jgi:beta-glucosidase